MYIYRAIIFDLDGTLFKTDTIFIEALNRVCIGRGLQPFEGDKIIDLIGRSTKEICKLLFEEAITDDEIEAIRSEIREIEDKLLGESGMLYHGVSEMLHQLKAKDYILCICTNGSEVYASKIIESFGIRDKFSIIKSRVEGFTKAQQIKQILDQVGCCSAIVVGDRITDFEAAEKKGCLSIGVSYGYGAKEYRKADFFASTPMDIYNMIEKINNIYSTIANQIIKCKKKNKPLIVGINGVDTSGKTTFTKDLASYLRKLGLSVQTIHMDDFLNPSEIRYRDPDPILTYVNNGFNLERIESELLKPVVEEGFLYKELTLLNLETDKFDVIKRYSVNQETIILFEGVLLYREPIDKYFDLRIYLDVSFDEVLKRASIRDQHLMGVAVIEKYQQKYIPIQKWYIEKFRPMERSEIIINNEDYNKPEIICIGSNDICGESNCKSNLQKGEKQ